MRGRVSTTVVLAWIAALGACANDADEAATSANEPRAKLAPAANESLKAYADPATRFRFDLPSPSFRVDRRRFDPTSPPNKVKERFEIRRDGQLMTRVDVWKNADELALDAWVQAHAGYLYLGGTTVDEGKAGRGHVRALVFDTPKSCQAPNIVTALFALRGHIVSVTCRDGEDPEAKRAFDAVVGSFAMEAAR